MTFLILVIKNGCAILGFLSTCYLYDKIQGFERKLKLWKQHLLQNNVFHFPSLEKEKVTTSQKYAQYIDILINEFQLRF